MYSILGTYLYSKEHLNSMPSESKVALSSVNSEKELQRQSKFREKVPVWNEVKTSMILLCAGILLLPLPYLKYPGFILVVAASIRSRKDYVSFLGRREITRLISIALPLIVISIFITQYAILESGIIMSDTFLPALLKHWFSGEIFVLFDLSLVLAGLVAVLLLPYVLFYTETHRLYWILAICVSLLFVVFGVFFYMHSEFQSVYNLLLYGQISSVEATARMVSTFSYALMALEIPYGLLAYILLKSVRIAAYQS